LPSAIAPGECGLHRGRALGPRARDHQRVVERLGVVERGAGREPEFAQRIGIAEPALHRQLEARIGPPGDRGEPVDHRGAGLLRSGGEGHAGPEIAPAVGVCDELAGAEHGAEDAGQPAQQRAGEIDLPLDPPEARGPGLADALELGLHRPPALGDEADGHALLTHRGPLPCVR
jgi:hypothetical protein